MAKLLFRIVLIILLLTCAAYACVDGANGTTSKGGTLSENSGISISGSHATATFGAAQFYLQLTAIAPADH